MVKDAHFLNYRPSQNAAACLLAAMNLTEHPSLCRQIEVEFSQFTLYDGSPQVELENKQSEAEAAAQDNANLNTTTRPCPMRHWTRRMV